MTRSCMTWIALLAAMGCDGGTAPPLDSGPGPCQYPAFNGAMSVGDVFPDVGYQSVMHPDDSTFEFHAHDFFCSTEYEQYTSMIVVVVASWCTHCPDYIRMMNGMAEALAAQGSLLVYIDMETTDFTPATSTETAAFIQSSIMPTEFAGGLRAGDGDHLSEDSLLRPYITQFASAFFVRRRDMHIVADQSESIYVVDWMSLAANPEQNWAPVPPTFVSHCTATDEEPGEPNDHFAEANPIVPGTEIMGGICAEGSDFYRVDVAGPWRFDLYQSILTMPMSSTYDANLRLWSLQMQRIGGSNVRGNHDWVDFTGPAFVEVYGEQNASGLYRVSVTPR